MNKNVKKGLIISGIVVDVAITVFLFVIAIIMLATLPNLNGNKANAVEVNGPFIGYLQLHATDVYLPCFVLPLFVLLIANIAFLVIYVKKAGAAKAVEVADLDAAQKEALKAELLKDLTSKEEDK